MNKVSAEDAARRLELFPPFSHLGIRVLELDDEWREVRILLPLNKVNRNPGGSMFGGSIASLADPIPALACLRHFPQYTVWTRELRVDFRLPGVTDLELRFSLSEEMVEGIAHDFVQRGRSTPVFEFGFFDDKGNQVVWVKNWVALRPDGRGAIPKSGA
jgi:uncharacterized protein (TIGR00369 family)